MECTHLHSPRAQSRICSDDIERPAATEEESSLTLGETQLLTIGELSTRFAENVNAKFGEQSYKSMEIYEILARFKSGKIPKKEAVSLMFHTLNSHRDLQHDLTEILYHKDARWALGDFDFPDLSPQPIPQFLQPVHQPQLRLLSTPSTWDSTDHTLQPLNPEVPSSFGEYNGFQQEDAYDAPLIQAEQEGWAASMYPSSMVSMNTNNSVPTHFTSPNLSHEHSYTSYPYRDHMIVTVPQHLKLTSAPTSAEYLNFAPGVDYHNIWSNVGPGQIFDQGKPLTSDPTFPHPVPHEASHTESASFHRDHSASITMYDSLQTQTGLSALPSNEIAPQSYMFGDPPLPKECNLNTTKGDAGDKDKVNSDELEDSPIDGGSASHRSNTSRATTKSYQDQGGLFVHNLCGKGFATRSKVKKHHWGQKQNDINTTTGCWAKHRKPNVSWDDHPSCQVEHQKSGATATRQSQIQSPLNQNQFNSAITYHSAPAAPSMIPNHISMAPGFHNLQEFPRNVVEALRLPQTPSQYRQDRPLVYHSHQPPSTSPFESLLTAVNVAARVEAPVEKLRNDSVISYLNAQAAGIERGTQLGERSMAFPSLQNNGNLEYAGQFEPIGHRVGLNMMDQTSLGPMATTVSSQTGRSGYASLIVSPSEPKSDFQDLIAAVEQQEENETGYSRYAKRSRWSTGYSASVEPEVKRMKL
ncbi:hypothetical protein GQ44DRAFT_424904 [Phaeosphaeriaceae sp. PMI808]|nr:hypothetical protein GQ44DRAFT_424904 [Phaeosphaeriaceae sp. PMI808]